MYSPKVFKSSDKAAAVAWMRRHPFATVVTGGAAAPRVSHIPLLVEKRGSGLVLLGHFARANPQWKDAAGAAALAVFHGPHGYVSPSWYADPREVPTWNYGVVHAAGTMRVVDDEAWMHRFMKKLVVANEDAASPRRWRYDPRASYIKTQIKAVVGFEIDAASLELKLKFSQNRSIADRRGVIRALRAKGGDDAARMAEIIAGNLKARARL